MIFSSFQLLSSGKRLLFALLLSFVAQLSGAQTTFLSGTIKDADGPLIGATIKVNRGPDFIRGVISGLDGDFRMPLDSGIYDVEIIYTGYQSQRITKVVVLANKTNVLPDVVMSNTVITEAIVVSSYKIPAYDPYKSSGAQTLSTEQMKGKPSRVVSSRPETTKRKGSNPKSAAKKEDDLTQKVESGSVTVPQPSVPVDITDARRRNKSDTIPREYSSEQYNAIVENPFQDASKSNISTFSIDVDAASYSNLRRFLNAGSMPPADAVRIEEMINYFDYQYNAPTGAHPFEANVEVAPCPWNTDNRLMMIGLQGVKMDVEQLPASNLVFLIDVSGSMGTDDKLPLVIQSLDLLVDQLRPVDRVSIVVYAGAAGLVLPGTSGSEKGKIKASLGELYAGGSTAGGDGIKLAYATARNNFAPGGNNRVILCTDGDFNVGVSSEADLLTLIEEERKSGVYLTVLGFGTGNYQDGKMQLLADKGNGNHAYIDQLSEAQKVLVQEFGGTLFAIAKDVKLQLHFNPAIVAGYRLIGYENRMLATEDFNDDTKDAGELGSGHRVTALYEIVPKGHELPALTKADAALVVTQAPDKSVKITANDMMVMQLRYKKPKGDAPSQLMEYRLNAAAMKNKNESANFQLAAAVAEFGLLLRDSKYKSAATYAHALENAKKASSFDPNGYRKELVGLIETAARTTEKIK